MFKTPIRLVATGALLVGVPVWTATKIDPSQIMNALMFGGVAWAGLNMVMYIRDIANTPTIEAYDDEDLGEAYTTGYLNARDEVGSLARQREATIRKYYEDKLLSSVGDETKKIVNITNNDYSTVNNVNAVPQLGEDNNVIDTKLIKG